MFDVKYLLTGEESASPHAWSEEAEIIASIVDRMQPQTRQMMVENAQSALQCEQKIRENLEAELLDAHREIAQLLEENISLLSNSDRMIVDAYIDRIGHRNARR